MQHVKVIKAGNTSNQSAFLSVNPTDESQGIKEIYRVFARARAMIKTVIATCDATGHEDKDDEITHVVSSLIAADDLLTDTIRRVTAAKQVAELDDAIEGRAYSVAGILHVASKVMWGECDGTVSTEHLVHGHQVLEAAEEMLNDHAESIGTKIRSAA